MPRNYTLPTIKTLYAEASSCAFPGCKEPLILRERGLVTVVSDIAHIRSEVPDGPRFDNEYLGDIDGLDNLLLLCVKHHRLVDRHVAAYSISELEAWKERQRRSAGSGTPIPAAALREYERLSTEERQAMAGIARSSERLVLTCADCQGSIDHIHLSAERARLEAFARFGTVYEVDEGGMRVPLGPNSFSLSKVERDEWKDRASSRLAEYKPEISKARMQLAEELAVVRMMMPSLRELLESISQASDSLAGAIGVRSDVDRYAEELRSAVTVMWSVAVGKIDPQAPSEVEDSTWRPST